MSKPEIIQGTPPRTVPAAEYERIAAEGEMAARAGRDPYAIPYRCQSLRWTAWRDGYRQEQERQREASNKRKGGRNE